MRGTKTLFSHKSVDWITPQYLFQPIKEAFNIQLDPCAHDTEILDPNIRSIKRDEDGLIFEWDLNTFINPPYADIDIWVDKAITQSCENKEYCYVLLLPSRTDRPWFRRLVQKAIALCFMEKRIKFSNAKNNAPFPSLIAVLGCGGSLSDEQYNLLQSLGSVI